MTLNKIQNITCLLFWQYDRNDRLTPHLRGFFVHENKQSMYDQIIFRKTKKICVRDYTYEMTLAVLGCGGQ